MHLTALFATALGLVASVAANDPLVFVIQLFNSTHSNCTEGPTNIVVGRGICRNAPLSLDGSFNIMTAAIVDRRHVPMCGYAEDDCKGRAMNATQDVGCTKPGFQIKSWKPKFPSTGLC